MPPQLSTTMDDALRTPAFRQHSTTDSTNSSIDENVNNNNNNNNNKEGSRQTTRSHLQGSSSHLGDAENSGGESVGTSESQSQKQYQDLTNTLRDTIIQQEERAVRKTRILVGVTVVTCALAIILAVFMLAKTSDLRSFELDYEGFTSDITALVRWEMRYNFALMEQLSAQISIASRMMNSTFPFHTDPQFEITGGFVDGMGGIMSAAFAPLVTVDQREEWENYAVSNQGWLDESVYLKRVHPIHRDALHGTIQDHEHDRRHRRMQNQQGQVLPEAAASGSMISPFIYRYDERGNKLEETNAPGKVFAPLWQVSPADAGVINVNLFSDNRVSTLYKEMLKTNSTVISHSTEIGDMFGFLFDPEEEEFKKDPHGLILGPVYTKIEENPTLAGIIIAVTPYGNLLDRLLPEGTDGIIGVFDNHCGDVISFELSSGKAKFLGYGDFHDPAFDEYERLEANLEMYEKAVDGLCIHNLSLYPTEKFKSRYETSNKGTYAAICGVSIALGAIFLIYDTRVTKRQNKTMQSAMRSRAVVNSLFPEKIARDLVDAAPLDKSNRSKGLSQFESYMDDTSGSKHRRTDKLRASKPLADLFPEATVMFGDLVGFTAWSSLREPHQVFVLLETIYSTFDEIASRRKVFKVETIGDCYVAVCGLPTPRKDHAIIMAKFASECCCVLPSVLQELEVELGPDTSTLGMRIGLHSGPVTAGVLRGERARFQLFGDTVNTTSRIESTGEKNRIHISEDTANRLIDAGKEHWVQPREDKVSAKGKGELNTFWLQLKNNNELSVNSSQAQLVDLEIPETPEASQSGSETQRQSRPSQKLNKDEERFVAWAVDILKRSLTNVLEQRIALRIKPHSPEQIREAERQMRKNRQLTIYEVQDVIELPKYKSNVNTEDFEEKVVEFRPEVSAELYDFVCTVACMYRKNSFHNFEHACHVLMSSSKLLSRIISPDIEVEDDNEAKVLHDHTYGITSDPLTQFAVLFSALIHDLDHPGVPNTQLTKENDELAVMYEHKSAAEQHSADMAWELLMEDDYKHLRRAIYSTEEELLRFRQLTVNVIMATDIMDKQLGQLRKARWNKAFSEDNTEDREKEGIDADRNRKATIVIEHLIQASDVAHTMQHWHVYKKWNGRLFFENYQAYREGRAEKNPLDGWYEGEIGFFDFYIIPLAKQLESCGIFGVSSDEYLSYAMQNRREWERKGREVVAEYAETVKQQYS